MDDTYTSRMLVPLLPFSLKAIKTSCDLLLQACDLAKLRAKGVRGFRSRVLTPC